MDSLLPSASSPPTSPASALQRFTFPPRPSSANTAMHRAKRSSSRIDGLTSRSSDEDSKTAVKVAVRVRPELKEGDPGYDLIPHRFRGSTCEAPTATSLAVHSQQGKKLFVFDRVFDQDTGQEGVWDYLSDSVSSFVKGYNVSILAYGQSGSGKSYTMGTSGPDDQAKGQVMGIVPRAARALFEKLNGAPPRQTGLQTPKRYSTPGLSNISTAGKGGSGGENKSWSLKATYVEIYQEQLRDLLVSESIPVPERAQVAIREDTKGRILVTGLTQITINSVEDLLSALNFGSSIRQTDATNINARSSRSHAVFSLNLVQKKSEGGASKQDSNKRSSTPVEHLGGDSVVTIDSKLHFVDLAGSERLKNTGATGDRAKEGISINAGLASLGKVISQLSSKSSHAHISYRDSRLTRLLQDSLGGNAITFMVACVTPAGFHLSETLNTVQYAQRARAIQSRPEIQQSHEESDKSAALDRLRAEVAFLRDQIRHSERNGESKSLEGGRSDKSRAKEAELQTQLMDMQENYNALSGRQAKLISELSKARAGEDTDTPVLREAIGDNAMDRVNRSNSFAEAVEQMVMEYEKTIQSLESSLSKTRGSLSNSESTLLEKETRIAYMETTQQQLQARIQKAIDREQNSESYLRDLEARMEGTTSGAESNASIINELRKELARAREGENGAEDYISTLEERLAEGEQDQEIMQREIDRLEHVIERQRSIGRLDNLLGELDGPATNGRQRMASPTPQPNGAKSMTNGHRESYDPFRSSPMSDAGATEQDDFEESEERGSFEKGPESQPGATATENAMEHSSALAQAHNATQQDFMADKLENISQELFDLQGEHEIVTSDYDKLQQKYQTALETLAKMEYGKQAQTTDEHPEAGKVTSFLTEAGMRGEEKVPDMQGRPSSSRPLSGESSLQQQPNTSLEDLNKKVGDEGEGVTESEKTIEPVSSHDIDPARIPLPDVPEDDNEDEAEAEVEQDVEAVMQSRAEREGGMAELTKNYNTLQSRHEATLAQVDELKQEVARAQNFRPASPSLGKHMRRKKSEDVLGSHSNNSDRTSRSFAWLKNLTIDGFEHNPDSRQSYETNLNTVMTELHSRSDLVQSLEAELATVRREMESKQTLIAGLTRERSSMKASSGGVDLSVMGHMRDQLMESENQIRALHEQHAVREKELQDEIQSLKASLSSRASQLPAPAQESQMPGDFPETPADDAGVSRELGDAQATTGASAEGQDQADDIARLQRELTAWESKHSNAMESMKSSESRLLTTIADLESSLHRAETEQQASRSTEERGIEGAASESLDEERSKHKQIVDALQKEVDQYRSTASGHVSKLEQLEQSYSKIVDKVDEDAKSSELTSRELNTHKELVANLESQLQEHKAAVSTHQESLEYLQTSHSKELEASTQRHQALTDEHQQAAKNFESELANAHSEKAEILRSAAAALGTETDATKLESQIRGLVEEGKELHARHLKTSGELKAVQEELANAHTATVALETKVAELKAINEETIHSLEKVSDKERKSSRLVEELEEQLNSNFDSHQAANHRLSTMQDEVSAQRMQLERELEDQKMRNQMLEQQIGGLNRSSVNSNASGTFNRDSLSPDAAAVALARSGSSSSQGHQQPPNQQTRKSTGPTALPVPPPSIPLPPLPGSENRAASPTQNRATSPLPNGNTNSPPASRHASKDIGATATASAQQLEEQETRIRTIEKHLFAEKQLTATLEEALVDLETSANRTKSEMDSWRKKCVALEDEMDGLRKERGNSRASLQAVEEEREMRVRAERARTALEQRMAELNGGQGKKKKKGGLNCF